jgi:hypothetical protein
MMLGQVDADDSYLHKTVFTVEATSHTVTTAEIEAVRTHMP